MQNLVVSGAIVPPRLRLKVFGTINLKNFVPSMSGDLKLDLTHIYQLVGQVPYYIIWCNLQNDTKHGQLIKIFCVFLDILAQLDEKPKSLR